MVLIFYTLIFNNNDTYEKLYINTLPTYGPVSCTDVKHGPRYRVIIISFLRKIYGLIHWSVWVKKECKFKQAI